VMNQTIKKRKIIWSFVENKLTNMKLLSNSN
jgi:hypothetical protein